MDRLRKVGLVAVLATAAVAGSALGGGLLSAGAGNEPDDANDAVEHASRPRRPTTAREAITATTARARTQGSSKGSQSDSPG